MFVKTEPCNCVGPKVNIQTKCNMLNFAKIMDKTKKYIEEEELKLLKATPFWPIISAYHKGQITEERYRKSDRDVMMIVEGFNNESNRFKFGDKEATLTPDDISKIFLLPKGGEEIFTGNKGEGKGEKKKTRFNERYFKKVGRPNKTSVEEAITKVMKSKKKEDKEDFVRLLIIALCITVLLPNSSNTLAWKLVDYCIDFKKMPTYGWAERVHKSLTQSLRQGAPPNGCSVALLVMKLSL